MKPTINVVTLAVSDLDRALRFYRDGLGFKTEGLIGTEYKGDKDNADGTTAMFDMGGGLILSIYPRSELAQDAGVPDGQPNATEFSVGQLVHSRDEVDHVLADAHQAGAKVVEAPRDRPWGIYSGYFQDPDGHLWEIICNPAMPQNP